MKKKTKHASTTNKYVTKTYKLHRDIHRTCRATEKTSKIMQHNINMLVYGKDMLYLPYAHYSGGTCIYIIIQMFATNNLKKKAQTQTTYTQTTLCTGVSGQLHATPGTCNSTPSQCDTHCLQSTAWRREQTTYNLSSREHRQPT